MTQQEQEWETDLGWSAKVFAEVVLPVIRDKLTGTLVMTESKLNKKENPPPHVQLFEYLDLRGGIDGWLVEEDRVVGVASRVQQVKADFLPWRGFTIRTTREATGASTELEKRQYAIQHIEEGWVWPGIAIQAFVEPGTLRFLSAAAARTYDLIQVIQYGTPKIDYVPHANGQDGNNFVAVLFDYCREHDLMLWDIPYESPENPPKVPLKNNCEIF